MKKILLPILYLHCLVSVFGQKKINIDSLIVVYSNTKIDSIKVKASNRITSYYMYRDINKAKYYAHKQLKLSERLDAIEWKIKANNHLSTIHTVQTEYDSALYYIEKTLELAKKANNTSQQSISQHALVILEIDRGNFDKAMELNLENLEFNKVQNDTLALAMSYETESSIYIEKGQYLIGLKSVMKSLKIYESLKDSIRIADVFQKIAVTENSLENFDSGIDNGKKALDIYVDFEDIEYQASTLNILGISHKFKEEFSEAEKYFIQSLEISKANRYRSIEITSLAHLADVYLEMQKNEEAKKIIDEGLEIANTLHSDAMAFYFKLRLAIYYKNMEAYKKAYSELDSIAKENLESQEYLAAIYKLKSEVLKLQGNYQRALSNYESYKRIEDSASKKVNISKINELRIIHQTEQKEVEIALQEEEINTLNEKAKVNQLTKGLYAGGMASAIALSGLLVFGFRQRIKKNRIAREKQEDLYKQEIAHKKRELASQTLHLVQKNTFIKDLMENLESMKNSPDKFKLEFRRIVMLLKKENASDKDWEVFKTYFADVHNNFDQKLKTLYANISEKEIRLAAFLRMNLTTKEIAVTLNVMPDSVLKSKYRLKKKLGLSKEQDLSGFLNSI